MRSFHFRTVVLLSLWLTSAFAVASDAISIGDFILTPGHPSLQIWKLPKPSYPENNIPNQHRVALGKQLFFDTRLSGDGSTSCASCHNPNLGWSDGLSTATGRNGKKLRRATPPIINSAHNFLIMWDGRFQTLEAQVLAPLTSADEMNMPTERLIKFLKNDSEYAKAFSKAYPQQGISLDTLSMAIASFERTVISDNSPFDQWIRGNKLAMTESQVKGFEVFLNPDKGNCVICHSPPNFSDDGFHNIGVALDSENPDYGRFELVPIPILKGAFKTPALREIKSTAPYFHDGSAETLADVLDHYASFDEKLPIISPALTRMILTESEQKYLLDFFDALTGAQHIDHPDTSCTLSNRAKKQANKKTTNQLYSEESH